ncbi:MAG: TraB/GumN family protein [Pseudomonadota bacterium]
MLKKSPTLLLCAAALAFATPATAQTTVFNGATGNVDIPCIAFYRNGEPVLGEDGSHYLRGVQLHTNNAQQFDLAAVLPPITGDECLAAFDSGSGLYTDIVNVGDTAYEVVLQLGAGNVLTLIAHRNVGPAKTSLWVVSNGVNTVYLGGTVHVLRPYDHPLPRAYDEAYAKASVLYFEIDMDNPSETGANLTQSAALQLLRDPQGKRLNQVLSPATYSRLSNYLAGKSIPVANVETFSAQMIVNAFITDDFKNQAGATANGVDLTFANKAKADRKPIYGLETFQSQMTMIQALDEGREDHLITESLNALQDGSAPADLASIIQAWRLGDISTIQASMEELRSESARDYALVLTNRNNAWLPQIEALLQSPETELVLVGAAHVAGPEGLVTLLKNRGYSVRKY